MSLPPVAAPADQAVLLGGPSELLGGEQVSAFVHEQLAGRHLDGRSVCVVIPDATRSCPLPLLLTAVHGALAGRVSRLTALVALGTHAPMTDAQLARHLGGDPATCYPGMAVRNHEWADPDTFVSLGVIPAERVAELSEGRLADIHRAAETSIDVSLMDLTLSEKQIVGTLYGSANPRADIPKMLDLYNHGRLKLDELVTRHYSLDEVAQGYEDMHAGKNIRGVLVFD